EPSEGDDRRRVVGPRRLHQLRRPVSRHQRRGERRSDRSCCSRRARGRLRKRSRALQAARRRGLEPPPALAQAGGRGFLHDERGDLTAMIEIPLSVLLAMSLAILLLFTMLWNFLRERDL